MHKIFFWIAGCLPVWCEDSTYFEVLKYRNPKQCERMQCLSVQQQFCRRHLEGFYLMERGCKDSEQICTNCTYGNTTVPTECRCENLPFTKTVSYGDQCDALKECTSGQCFRPCYTYLHVTKCPSSHCMWNRTTYVCQDKPPPTKKVLWKVIAGKGVMDEQAPRIVEDTPKGYFPMDFKEFTACAKGYEIRGLPLEELVLLESLFISLDNNNDGVLSQQEFSGLPLQLRGLDAKAALKSFNASSSNEDRYGRRLLAVNGTVSPETCNEQRPSKVYCSFDVSCKLDCSSCGWKSAVDRKFYLCVQPSPATCSLDSGQVYCPTDKQCHPRGDCTGCPDMPIVDFSQKVCLSPWWFEEPPTQWMNWVCRFRNKVGMKCLHDQDCIHGLRRCLGGKCQPLQPYNENHTCATDHDCPHLGYYCPVDPTGGENPYWVQYCRKQRSVGEKCAEDRECAPTLRCNTAAKTPRCERLFSLEVGLPAVVPELCLFGWNDKNDICAVPAKSKEVGRSCQSDGDCITTDQSGKTGICACKAWWDQGDSKYCLPVSGDFNAHSETLRDYLYFKGSKCGTFWTDEECMQQWGAEGEQVLYRYKCEEQKLARGPYLPPTDCGIVDEKRFIDYCKKLDALSSAWRHTFGGMGLVLVLFALWS